MEVAKKAVEAAESALPEVRVYRRRWLILALYFGVLFFNAVPWMQYTVLADVVTKYFGVSNELVEWTAMVYNATAMVLVFPAAYVLDKFGIRLSVLLGALTTSLGLWLRVLGCWPDSFWAVLAGHALVSVGTNFVVSAPPRVAAVWFPANEVSTAVGASIIGQMGGVSLGCMLAPLTARTAWTNEENFAGFLWLNVSLAVASTVLLVATFFLFEDAPPLPPSPAQAAAATARSAAKTEYIRSMVRICKDWGFIRLLVGYNLLICVYVAITTLLNRDIIEFYPDRGADTGFLATLVCLTGMVATFVVGVILDKTKKFKELSSVCFLGGLVTVIMYSVCIAVAPIEALYVVAGVMGIFMTSFFVPGYEYAVELTYPEPEGNPTSLLNWVMQPCSLLAVLVYGHTFTSWGANAAHGLLVAFMVVGFVLMLSVPRRYRRREAEMAAAANGHPDELAPLKGV